MKEQMFVKNKEGKGMEMLSEKQKAVIEEVKAWVEDKFTEGPPGHSIKHVKRVAENAKEICRAEGGNEFLVTLAAWLHDLGRIPEAEGRPYKIGSYEVRRDHANLSRWEGSEKLRELYKRGDLSIEDWRQIQRAVSRHSRLIKDPKRRTKLLEILQDADRLDAFGIIGVIRCLLHAQEREVSIETTELPSEFSDSDYYDKLRGWDDAKSTLSHLWYVYKYKDDLTTEAAKEKVKPGARIYRDFIELLKNSILKREGRNYQFWFDFLEYAKKKNLRRLSENDVREFEQRR